MEEILKNVTTAFDLPSLVDLNQYGRETVSQYDIVFYFAAMLALLIIYILAISTIRKNINDKSVTGKLENIVQLATGFVAVLTTMFIFSRHIGGVIGILGVFSAALVVALQDFVSSFFAWVFIMSKEKYRVGDIIKIAGNRSYIYGKVSKIEIFRTLLEERMGDADFNGNLNKEMPTGRIVSIPNNMIMKGAVMNFTLENRALWHANSITITYDSDFELAEKTVQGILNQVFNDEYYLKHNLPIEYQPKLSFNLADSGICFSFWFPANVGKFRETLDNISRKILIEFKKNKISLAYNTLTINTKFDDKDTIEK